MEFFSHPTDKMSYTLKGEIIDDLVRACQGLLSVMEAECDACGIYKAHKEQAERAIDRATT